MAYEKDFSDRFINKCMLTKNISLRECIYGTDEDAPKRLVSLIKLHITQGHLDNLILIAKEWQQVRDYFNAPVIIHWGGAFRPLDWEIAQGRSGKSQHVLGKAIDAHVKGVPLKEVYGFINKTFESGGRAISVAGNFIHKDIRPYYATWTY